MFSKKLFKRIICFILVVFVVYNVYNYKLLIYTIYSTMLSGEGVLCKNLEKNYDEHLDCIKYFNDLGIPNNYKEIYISRNLKDDWDLFVYYNYNNDYDTIAITDENIIQMLDNLEDKCDYYLINWKKEYIYFLSSRGSTRDSAMGLLYSFSNNTPKVEDALELEKIDKPNWYFYYSG